MRYQVLAARPDHVRGHRAPSPDLLDKRARLLQQISLLFAFRDGLASAALALLIHLLPKLPTFFRRGRATLHGVVLSFFFSTPTPN
jgi:hypothetical protein